MADPVLNWTSQAHDAERATGVPASVLLGLVKIESGGIEGLTSSAGAQGLTQFIPSTAKSYGVNTAPGHADSQIMGAAKYLVALGFKTDPQHALAAYNGGPGNADLPQTQAYARNVLAAAKSYARFDGGGGGSSGATSPASTPSTSSSSSSALIDSGQHSTLVKVGVTAGLVLAGVGAVVAGGARAAGVRAPTGAKA